MGRTKGYLRKKKSQKKKGRKTNGLYFSGRGQVDSSALGLYESLLRFISRSSYFKGGGFETSAGSGGVNSKRPRRCGEGFGHLNPQFFSRKKQKAEFP